MWGRLGWVSGALKADVLCERTIRRESARCRHSAIRGFAHDLRLRVTAVLAREGRSWKFIAWHCGDEPKDDLRS